MRHYHEFNSSQTLAEVIDKKPTSYREKTQNKLNLYKKKMPNHKKKVLIAEINVWMLLADTNYVICRSSNILQVS